MTTQEFQSKKILACYTNNLEKGNQYTYEWKTVRGKDRVFQRRYRVKIGSEEDFKKEVNPLGSRNTQNSAALSDRLLHGLYLDGNFYDNKGERIHLSDEQLKQAKKEYSQKQLAPQSEGKQGQRSINTGMKEKKDQILSHIQTKDPYYLKHVEKLKNKHEELNNSEEVRRRRVESFLDNITIKSKPSDILQNLKYTRQELHGVVDPTLLITIEKDSKETQTTRQLDDLISSFKKMKDEDLNKVKIKDIKIKDWDQYKIDDFEKREFKMSPQTHKEIYEKINRKLKS